MTDEEGFMLQAAEDVGFRVENDDGTAYSCTDQQIFELMTRAREQGRRDRINAEIGALVQRFLTWQLPASVCADLCATDPRYAFPRSGTNLLSAAEAEQMLRHVLGAEQR
jgi:hypothetical protein